MKKKFSIILIALIALGLVACTDASQNKATDENLTIEETNETLSDEIASSEESDASEQEN